VEAIALAISNDVDPLDQQDILSLFSGTYDAMPSGARIGPEWAEWFLVAKEAAPVFATSASIVALVNNIIDWRKRIRAKGARPAAQLTANGETLDLTDASDEEVAAWARRQLADDK
jgi:hypothetical protein